MSVLLNEIVGECLNLGIDTMSPKELKSLKKAGEVNHEEILFRAKTKRLSTRTIS